MNEIQPEKKITDADIKDIVELSGVLNEQNDSEDNDDGINEKSNASSLSDNEKNFLKSSVTVKNESKAALAGLSWTSTLRLFIKKNSEMLSILLALFILTEGIAVVKFTQYWWIPVIVIGGLTILTFLWKNSKATLKAIIAIIIMAVVISFQMLFGTSYSMSSVQAIIIPAFTMSAFFIFICISYMIDTNVSRWSAVISGLILGFIFSYAFITLGLFMSALMSAVGIILGGIIWMFTNNMVARRTGSMPARPKMLQSNQTSLLKESLRNDYDVIEYTKCKYPFYILLDKNKPDDDTNVIIMQPLEFKTAIIESSKRGLVYHHRKIGEYFYKVATYSRSRTDSNAIILFGDWSGTLKKYGIIGIDMVDSNNVYSIGLINMSQGRKRIRKDITDMISRFSYPHARKGNIKRIKKLLNAKTDATVNEDKKKEVR